MWLVLAVRTLQLGAQFTVDFGGVPFSVATVGVGERKIIYGLSIKSSADLSSHQTLIICDPHI